MELREQYEAQFKEILNQLNPAQKSAVEQIEGPVLVVAGPGTGKTQILSARIGNILKETDTLPQNILCLTYTDAGTIAMRKRLNTFIGPDAHNVHIFTFHGFCNKVIQENLDYFGIRELQPCSDIEKVEFLQELIDSFDNEHILKRFIGEVYYERSNLESLFKTMKQEGWTEQYIKECVVAYLNDLPNREDFQYKRKYKEFNKGDIKQHEVDKKKELCDKLLAAVSEFKNYNNLLLKNGRYDYDDMIIWVLKALQDNEYLRLRYQEQYLYFLVDEYQDTNGAQNQILQLLSSYWDVPNVFVVGDDDQSIYRFQGANIKNIKDFYDSHAKSIKQVVLTENYRSNQPILDLAKFSIEHNEDRLVNVIHNLTKELHASGKLKDDTTSPQIVECVNPLHEELFILKKIEELKNSGFDLSKVAVIYHNHKMVERLLKTCVEQAIPVNIKKRINILELPFVQHLLAIFRYIFEEQQRPDQGEFALFHLLHFEPFKISANDILKIARACQGQEKKKWRDVINNRELLERLQIESVDAVSTVATNLSQWISDAENYTLQIVFEKILTKGNILEYIMHHSERMWLLQIVTTYFDFIKKETSRKPKMTIEDFLELIEKHELYNLDIPVNKIYQSQVGVNFVTAHSSKGLEFEYVFLLGCNAGNWEAKRKNNKGYFLPDTLTFATEENTEEEERRLFYVALTRAEKHLYVSYNTANEDGKELMPSKFIAELEEFNGFDKKQIAFSDDDISTYYFNLLTNTDKPSLKLIDSELIEERLQNFKLSVTSLNKYLKCPITFYFETIIRVPTARNSSMGFGSAIHYALENYFLEMMASGSSIFPGEARLLALFKKGMDIYRSHFTDKDYKLKLEFAELVLPKYLAAYETKWNTTTRIEYPIDHVNHKGVPLSGKLDKLEFDGNNVNVVDYKTGKPENGLKKIKPPSEKDPNGGDYWRQMVFYKILMDADNKKDWNMVSAEMDFIQPNKKEDFDKAKLVISPQDVETVSKQITESYVKIMNHEFSEGCGDKDCTWCNFVKTNYNSSELDFSEQTLDDE